MVFTFDDAFNKFASQHRPEGKIYLPRIARLSPSLMTIGYEPGGRLGFVYDVDALTLNTNSYTAEIFDYGEKHVGYLDPSTVNPGITTFDDALKIAKNIFKHPFNTTPDLIRDFRPFS